MAEIVLGGGCFWCTEAVFQRITGVSLVEPGYSGGTIGNPTYEQVCSGTTGHAEVVRVVYDSHDTTLADILDVFFASHDPTTLNRQGADAGTQYRSVIFYADASQKAAAEKAIQRVEIAGFWKGAVVTELAPLQDFFPAEDYHYDYFNLHQRQPYCQLVIQPKLTKLKNTFPQKTRP